MEIAEALKMLQHSGPYGLSTIFLWLYLKERAYASGLAQKLLEHSVKHAEISAAQAHATESLKELLTYALKRD